MAALATVSSKLDVSYVVHDRTKGQRLRPVEPSAGGGDLLGISDLVSSIGERQSHCIRAVLLCCFPHRQEVSRTFAHLLSVQHEMTVGPDGLRPVLLGEDRGVDIDAERQVVVDEILPRRSKIEGIEVLEVVFELRSLFEGQSAASGILSRSEDVTPNLVRHVFWSDSEGSGFRAEHVVVKKISHRVVGHVDGRIG